MDPLKVLESKSQDELDELVHDMKAEEAASINNSGKEEQIEYLINAGWEPEEC